jgi:RluA family pseudouridine synthase
LTHRAAQGPARIVHEDEVLVVVDKPAGLLTIGTERERRRTLHHWLFERERRRRRGGRVFIVHRLDRDASGLVVFAKSEDAKLALQAQFRARAASRVYRAVVEGRFPEAQREFRSHLAQNRAYSVYVTPDARRGKLAITRVRVLRRAARATLLEVVLGTGRKHQIRVHLADAGHPVLGDRRYGGGTAKPRERLALHAFTLEFDHPQTGERLRFCSPVPRPLLDALRRGGRGHRLADRRPRSSGTVTSPPARSQGRNRARSSAVGTRQASRRPKIR